MEVISSDYTRFQEEIENAVEKYGSSHIDILYSEAHGICGMYHSSKNSFGVTKIYGTAIASKEEIQDYCDSLDIGYCED